MNVVELDSNQDKFYVGDEWQGGLMCKIQFGVGLFLKDN